MNARQKRRVRETLVCAYLILAVVVSGGTALRAVNVGIACVSYTPGVPDTVHPVPCTLDSFPFVPILVNNADY